MSNYSKTTDFAAKDSLPSGDSGKIIRGSEFETEFDAISTAIATKADAASPTFTGTVTIDGLTVNGNTTLGNAATDTVTVTADIASNLIPSADDTYNLGASGAEWNDLFIDGTANIDSLVADTADINGGTIDGVTIGGSSAGAITGTTITGTSFVTSGDMTFGDNDKAVFGAGSDLQIYHDGSNSYIEESGTGSLFIRGQGRIKFQNSAGDETLADFLVNDRVDLYYDNSIKLATTSTGIDVTGSVVSDGLDIDGSSSGDITLTGAATSNTGLFVKDPTATTYGAFFGYDDTNTVVHIGGITDGTKNAALVIGRDNNIVQFSGGGDVQFYEDTGSTVKMNWDASAESLGIGVGAPQASLHIANDASRTQFIASGTVGNDRFLAIDLDITGSEDVAYITCDQADSLAFGEKTNDNDRTIVNEHMRIDPAGRVGIGTTAPGNKQLSIVGSQSYGQLRLAQNETDEQDQRMALTFRQYDVDEEGFIGMLGFTNSSGNQLVIGGGTGDFNCATVIRFATANDGITTQGTDRARITNGGHFLVGKTVQDQTNTVGFEAKDDGLIAVTTDGGIAGLFNRKTSDGAIVEFRKNNVTVGEIGVFSGDMLIGLGDHKLRFFDSSSAISPCVNAGTVNDNTIDLGVTNSRFKDLYLGGGLYVGGFAAANKLDDYEEGTFTPVFADASSGGNTGTTTSIAGTYTKVGRLVTISIYAVNIDTTGMTAGNSLIIRGLPFNTIGITSQAINVGSCRLDNFTFTGNYVTPETNVANSDYLVLKDNDSGAADQNLNVSSIASGSADLFLTLTYITA